VEIIGEMSHVIVIWVPLVQNVELADLMVAGLAELSSSLASAAC
jgi:hypothetical protein